MSKVTAVCQSCKSTFTTDPKKTFLGFQKLKCYFCGVESTYPLSQGYRITYWVIFAIMAATIANSFSEGQIGLPGGLGIGVLVALFIDWRLKRKIAHAQAMKSPGQV